MRVFFLFLSSLVAATIFSSYPVVGGFGSPPQVASWIKDIRSLDGLQLVVEPDQTHSPVVNLIMSAEKSVYMEMYHLSSPPVIEALKSVAKKKLPSGNFIQVYVLLDSKSLSNPRYLEISKDLSNSGVQIIKSSPGFSSTHTKSFLVDEKYLFISTMNLVGHYYDMRDFGVITKDLFLIQEFMLLFRTDIENSKNTSALTPAITDPNLIMSPTNSKQKLIDLIDSASYYITFEVENFGDKELIEALVAAAKRNVVVQAIVPKCNLMDNAVYNFPGLYSLAAGGAKVDVRVMPPPASAEKPYIHGKTMIIDGVVAYVGSENFTFTSLTKNRELGVLFRDRAAISKILEIIKNDYRLTQPLPQTPPTDCPSMRH